MVVQLDWLRPSQVLEYFERASEAFRKLTSLPRDFAVKHGPEMTESEFHLALEAMTLELDQHCVLLLTASVEATFQTDLRARDSRKLNDHVSNGLRGFLRSKEKKRRHGSWIDIEELLDVWKNQIGHVQSFGHWKQVIEYRHWLAHGRYWIQKSGLHYVDMFDAWERWEFLRDRIREHLEFPIAVA